MGILPKRGSGLVAGDYYGANRRQENWTLPAMSYRLVATMDSRSRHLRLAVEHTGPTFIFFVSERDTTDASVKQVVATGTADRLEEAVSKAENSAQEYLSRHGEKVTVPFWIVEEM